MDWLPPDFSMEDLLKLFKGFVDMIILASGYQSSGHLAHWDSENIKNAFKWGLFLEKVLKQLSCSDDFQDLIKQLEVALAEVTSYPYFPMGLQVASLNLHSGRKLILEHLIHALPLRDAHLRAIMKASIEMDIDELPCTGNDRLHIYLEKLMPRNRSLNPILDGRFLMEDLQVSPLDILPNNKDWSNGNFSMYSIQEISRRQSIVSCMSSAQKGLDILSKAITPNKMNDTGYYISREQLEDANAEITKEQLIEPNIWNNWRTRGLSYLLDKRTVRLVSGASMIFSAPKVQWVQVLEHLDMSPETSDEILSDKIELLLLGCVASRWSSAIEHFMSASYYCLTISKQYHEVCKLLDGRSHILHSKEEMDCKERGALDYLEVLLCSQTHLLRKVSPVLASIAIPSWSQLFKLYLSELKSQFKGDYSKMSCFSDGKDKRYCDFAERIWCLYIFHVYHSYRRDHTIV